MIPTKINLEKYTFQNQYYVAGHYDYEIEVEYENGPNQKIKRRYSEIRALYKTLILKCPGCYIPNIPNKSIWLKIQYGNEIQMKDRMEGIKDFLVYLIEHKILRKNKYVVNFFSSKFKPMSINKEVNNENDSDDDEYNFSSSDIDNSKKEKNEDDENNSDDDDIEPLKEYIEEYTNKNKGIMSKGKKIFGNMYNYVMSYTTSSNNKDEEGEEHNNNNENNNLNNCYYKKLTKEDYEFIKKKSKELGEDFEINNYNEKINRLNEGVKNIIQNFEKYITIHSKFLHSLDNIVNNDNDFRNVNKEKDNEIKNKNSDIDVFNDNDDEEENCESSEINNHKDNIEKIKKYCTIQRGFLDKRVTDSLSNIRKYQILLQGLLDIYSRKKEHLNYLGRLHSEKEEIKKENKNNAYDNKINELEKKIKHQIKFIHKINKDLKYEIEKYKNNQEDIYIYINSLFKEKSNTIKNTIKSLNKKNFDEVKDDDDDDNPKNKEYNDEEKSDDYN